MREQRGHLERAIMFCLAAQGMGYVAHNWVQESISLAIPRVFAEGAHTGAFVSDGHGRHVGSFLILSVRLQVAIGKLQRLVGIGVHISSRMEQAPTCSIGVEGGHPRGLCRVRRKM